MNFLWEGNPLVSPADTTVANYLGQTWTDFAKEGKKCSYVWIGVNASAIYNYILVGTETNSMWYVSRYVTFGFIDQSHYHFFRFSMFSAPCDQQLYSSSIRTLSIINLQSRVIS